jgi:hypothetical protein
MDIYVGHPSRIDFEGELYTPLRESSFNEDHNLVFPHEESGLFDSKAFLRDEADVFLAEVSKPSTGLGIELGWADLFDVPVIGLFRRGSEPSFSLKPVTRRLIEYSDEDELVRNVKDSVEELNGEDR